ncbi:MAG TPA: hypothetical protein VIF63_05225 [Candidatus Limnocylindrales bacterium]|jgi:hypothetical protein
MTYEFDRSKRIAPPSPDGARPGRSPAVGREPIAFAAMVAIALVAFVLAPPDAQGSVGRVAILVIGIVAAWRVLGRSDAITASTSERFELDLAPPAGQRPEISGLRSVETALRMSSGGAFGLETMLKPRLRALVRWRLQRSHAVDLDAAPEAAQRFLGDRLSRLISTGGAGAAFDGPGAALDEVNLAINELEQL